MIDRFIEFVRRHSYETLLSVFGIIFASTILAAWNMIVNAVTEYPAPMVICCAISFLLGIVVSATRDRRAAKLKQIEENTKLEIDRRNREEEQRQQAIKEQEREERALMREREKVQALSFMAKDVLLALYDNGSAELDQDAAWNIEDTCNDSIGCYIDEEEVGNCIVRWKINEWYRSFFSENLDLFDSVREDKYNSRNRSLFH